MLLTMAKPTDSSSVSATVGALRDRYRFLNTVPIGYSILGKPLWALTLGDPCDRVLYTAAFDGTQSACSWLLLRLCERICAALAGNTPLCGVDLRRALAGRGLVFVPMLNPDGVDVCRFGAVAAARYESSVCRADSHPVGRWSYNVRGADIDRCFDTDPAAEPESGALSALCRHTAFCHAISVYTDGVGIDWHHGTVSLDRARLMASVMASTCNYPLTAGSHGGFCAWFETAFRRPALALRTGALSPDTSESRYRELEETLLLAALM